MTSEERQKIGYEGAMRMVSIEGRIIWSAFQTFLAANAFLVTFAGAVITLHPTFSWIALVMSTLGIAICLAWVLVLARQFCYFRYWIAWARELEERLLKSADVGMLSQGKVYGQGGEVQLQSGSVRMNWASRTFKIEWLMRAIIAIFLTLYVMVLVLSLAV